MTLCLLLEFRDGLDRSDDFGVVGQTLLAEAVRVRGWQLQVSDRQFGFDIAQRHRQQHAVRAGVALVVAEDALDAIDFP